LRGVAVTGYAGGPAHTRGCLLRRPFEQTTQPCDCDCAGGTDRVVVLASRKRAAARAVHRDSNILTCCARSAIEVLDCIHCRDAGGDLTDYDSQCGKQIAMRQTRTSRGTAAQTTQAISGLPTESSVIRPDSREASA